MSLASITTRTASLDGVACGHSTVLPAFLLPELELELARRLDSCCGCSKVASRATNEFMAPETASVAISVVTGEKWRERGREGVVSVSARMYYSN
jgi:hypothetical protein